MNRFPRAKPEGEVCLRSHNSLTTSLYLLLQAIQNNVNRLAYTFNTQHVGFWGKGGSGPATQHIKPVYCLGWTVSTQSTTPTRPAPGLQIQQASRKGLPKLLLSLLTTSQLWKLSVSAYIVLKADSDYSEVHLAAEIAWPNILASRQKHLWVHCISSDKTVVGTCAWDTWRPFPVHKSTCPTTVVGYPPTELST